MNTEKIVKSELQVFLFEDGSFQIFPDFTIDTKAARVLAVEDHDYNHLKVVAGEAVLKTQEDLAEEKAAEGVLLDAEYKAQREIALGSTELTPYFDSTWSADKLAAVNVVRQAWYSMTDQAGYPFDFVAPELNKTLFP